MDAQTHFLTQAERLKQLNGNPPNNVTVSKVVLIYEKLGSVALTNNLLDQLLTAIDTVV